jgi:hypothetical protein
LNENLKWLLAAMDRLGKRLNNCTSFAFEVENKSVEIGIKFS